MKTIDFRSSGRRRGSEFSLLLVPLCWDKTRLARASPMRNPAIRELPLSGWCGKIGNEELRVN